MYAIQRLKRIFSKFNCFSRRVDRGGDLLLIKDCKSLHFYAFWVYQCYYICEIHIHSSSKQWWNFLDWQYLDKQYIKSEMRRGLHGVKLSGAACSWNRSTPGVVSQPVDTHLPHPHQTCSPSSCSCLKGKKQEEESCHIDYNLKNKLEIFEDALFQSSKTSTHKMEKLAHWKNSVRKTENGKKCNCSGYHRSDLRLDLTPEMTDHLKIIYWVSWIRI